MPGPPSPSPTYPVFLSVTTPVNPAQEAFVAGLEAALRARGLEPSTLGRNQWSFEAPLIPVRRLMTKCCGTVAVALVRTLIESGIDGVAGPRPQPFFERYLATPWTQIETAMAFQLGHPILLLKQDRVHAEGVLDPAGSSIFVRSFALNGAGPAVPEDILCVLPQFYEMVAEFSRRQSG